MKRVSGSGSGGREGFEICGRRVDRWTWLDFDLEVELELEDEGEGEGEIYNLGIRGWKDGGCAAEGVGEFVWVLGGG